jgi:hypothetical protein
MTEGTEAHDTSTSMVNAPLAQLYAGIHMPLKVKVSCPSACDLRGKTVRIIAQDSVLVEEVALASFEEKSNETDKFTVKAPIELGECTWSVVFPAQEAGGILHEQSSTLFSFTVKPHATSIAVWDVPSPIAFNDKFKIKVGVKCSAECNLVDKEIRIYGQRGKKVATGVLDGVPWPGASGLYWAEVELEAPGAEGYHSWRVKFRDPDLELPHGEASYYFGFTTARPPEHVVTVEVIDKEAKTPITNADVLLHPYRGYTDERGMARLMVPKGEYGLYISRHKYKIFQAAVKVDRDVALKAELLVEPPPPYML